MKILLSAILENYTPRKDGSFTLKFGTQELGDDDLLQINRTKGGFGNLLFQENEIQPEDIEKLEESDIGGKTPSKRLYNTLYVLHQKTEKNDDGTFKIEWEQYYKQKMEKFIEFVKGKIPADASDLKFN